MKKTLLHFLCATFLFLPFLAAAPIYGADSTSFDPTKVEVKAKGSAGVPVGTIISWPVATNPEDMDNWLECNGQSISRSVYPELFAVLGMRGLAQQSVAGWGECGYKERARLPSGLSVGTAQTEKGGRSHAETCFRPDCRYGPCPLTDV